MTIPILCVALLHGYVLLDQVSINGAGPYRFLVDTGSQSTALRTQVARSLKLDPAYRVTLQTAAGSQEVPAAKASRIGVGSFTVEDVEVLWYDLHNVVKEHIDGILGQNFLSRFDFLLDVKRCELTMSPPSELADQISGEKVYFQNDDGLVRVPVRFSPNGRPRDFVLDSAAPALVLPPELSQVFETQASARFRTDAGDETVRKGIVRSFFIGRSAFRDVPAILQKTPLLPATLFDSIYINSGSKYVVINPKRR